MMKRILLRFLLALGLVIVVLVVNLLIFNITASKVSEGTPINNPNNENVALLVIDIQEGTTGEVSALKAHKEQSEMLINRVNIILEESSNKEQLIIYIRTEVANPLINILNNTLARGSKGAELDGRLAMKPGNVVVKRRNDPFIGTDLDSLLTDHQIGKVILVGLDATQCVKSAVQAALNRGYTVAVVEEAVISENEVLKAQALNEFRELGAEILSMN